ncbi:hypothetical protein BJ912DRAFT_980200 [Pholiota molesta]|nr:hypothetical protein BJ912DRAFT_980200 [Pholiota molesta]
MASLPPALLDLTLLRMANATPARLSNSFGHAVRRRRDLSWCRLNRRSGFNAGSLAIRNGDMNASQTAIHPVEELERRVQALDEVLDSETPAVRTFYYTEDDILTLYEDVMSQAALEAIRRAEAQEDIAIIDSCSGDCSMVLQPNHLRRRILGNRSGSRIFSRIDATRNAINPGTTNRFPLSVLSIREFEALMRQSVSSSKSNLPLSSDNLTTFLEMYASAGEVKAADELLANFLTETPTELQRHLHIKTHLRAAPPDEIPTSALDILHHYEEQNVPAPMQTYTSVITSLFSRPLALARAQAWDIFTHMRYVAHPYPDVVLYTMMIRACASPVSVRYSSEPEKALDLWTEMTVDRKIMPTVGSYNAIILACARSGEKTYVNEAFRLARQMLDSHRDAQGISAFRPDRKTFCALLEGAKRTGNLTRARWILAEMVAPKPEDDPNAIEAEIDEEIMMHIFNAYASYKPPVLKKMEEGSGSDKAGSHLEPNTKDVALQSENPSFAHIPPQSRAEVLREVRILLNRIIEERKGSEPVATPSLPIAERKFRNVEITPRLLGAYLSVFYKHGSLDASRELFWKLFDDLNVTRTPRIYVEALERCGNARRGPERQTVVPFADQLWDQWIALEDSACRAGKPLPSRLVERAHIAMIRTLAVTENTDRALSQLRAFAAKYPPNQKDIGYVTWLCKAYEWALRVRRDEAMKAKPPKRIEEVMSEDWKEERGFGRSHYS